MKIMNDSDRIKIYNDDCINIIKNIEDESIDLIVTSPPYDNLRTYENENIEQLWNFDKFKIIADELYRIIKEGAIIVWIVNDATINGSETGTSFRQTLYFKDIGLNLHDTMIWNKNCCTFPETVRYYPCFEYMFILSKGKPKSVHLIDDKINVAKNTKVHGKSRQIDGSLTYMSGFLNNRKIKENGVRFNVWNLSNCNSNTERTSHPAQFPIHLASDHIISWSDENDLVFDPFMGSGTTGIASLKNNRKFIGCEINSNYFEIARKRIDNELKLMNEKEFYEETMDELF